MYVTTTQCNVCGNVEPNLCIIVFGALWPSGISCIRLWIQIKLVGSTYCCLWYFLGVLTIWKHKLSPDLCIFLWSFIILPLSPTPLYSLSCLHSSLHPLLPSSPCWLGPSVVPAWIAARRQSSCHCCAACAGRPPAWWGAARPEIHPGPPLCTLPGQLMGWAGEECGSHRAPGTEQVGGEIGGMEESKKRLIHHFIMCCVTAASTVSRAIAFTVQCDILFVHYYAALY